MPDQHYRSGFVLFCKQLCSGSLEIVPDHAWEDVLLNLRPVRELLSAAMARTIRLLVRLYPAVPHHPAVTQGMRILVKIQGGVGDVIMCTPALRALRRGHPDAYIACVVVEAQRPLLEMCPHIDEIITVKQAAASRFGYFTRVARYLALVIRLATYHFDISLELTHYACVMLRYIPFMAGIEQRFGAQATTRRRSSEIYTVPVPMPAAGTQVAVRFMQVAVAAGGVPDGEQLECYVSPESRKLVTDLLGPVASLPLILVHPGCQSWDLRRWPEGSFAEVINGLQACQPARIVLIGVPSEMAVIDRVTAACRAPVEVITTLGLGGLQALLKRAHLLICNHSGPMHMAIALGTPVVAIFGPMDPNEWVGPSAPEWCRLIRAPIDCPSPSECPVYACMSKERRRHISSMCSRADAVCTEAVGVQPVLEAARELLACRRSFSQEIGLNI